MVSDYLNHLFKAGNEHSLHSPFLFEFYQDVIKAKSLPFDDSAIIGLRNKLEKDETFIKITDLGAGSKFSNKPEKKISSIAKTVKKSVKWANIIARIIDKYKYRTILEMGTSLGITTAMLSKAAGIGKVYTCEGCPETLKIANGNFAELRLQNVTSLLGDIDITLNNCLSQLPPLDLVFFDANHQYAPTMRYFRKCLEKAHEESCFIFDDIYWSKGMKQAWEEIKAHPKVSISLDFFQMGIVFFRKNQPKQHFLLKA
jgi:predicted O-methyltransferase YrrM